MTLRQVVPFVALANIAYFFVELLVALLISSVSRFADSIDFLEDATINGLILLALGWSAHLRARVGFVLAGVMLLPGAATLGTVFAKRAAPLPPAPLPLSATRLGARAVNMTCVRLLAQYRREKSSLARAAFLSARNDALANRDIIAAGVATSLTASMWPNLVI